MSGEPPNELADLLDDILLLLEGVLLMPALVLAGCLMWVGETLEALGHWLAEFVDEGGRA